LPCLDDLLLTSHRHQFRLQTFRNPDLEQVHRKGEVPFEPVRGRDARGKSKV
jgi:hypothetical protein